MTYWALLSFICQDQLFVPFPSLVAFQPVIPGSSSAPDTFPQTAALHRPSALPHRTALPAARRWKGARQLDQKGKSLPQVKYPAKCLSHHEHGRWYLNILTSFFVVQKALGEGDWCGCNRYKQPQPELWPGGGLWQQWLQGICVLLAPAQR